MLVGHITVPNGQIAALYNRIGLGGEVPVQRVTARPIAPKVSNYFLKQEQTAWPKWPTPICYICHLWPELEGVSLCNYSNWSVAGNSFMALLENLVCRIVLITMAFLVMEIMRHPY